MSATVNPQSNATAKSGTISVDDLFKIAAKLTAEREANTEARIANRRVLRDLRKMGLLSPSDSEKLDAVYPPRGEGKDDDND